MAGRGLEGLAVRPGENGESLVAVVWEGGYSRPDKSLSPDIDDYFPMLPLLLVHPLEAGTTGMLHVLEEYPAIPLLVPTPEGDGPRAQRFRATDLVWHRLPDDSWGFIVLLTSEDLAESPAYHYRWLQRFDMNGQIVGDHLDVENSLDGNMLGLNWEGLDWFEEGESLILVHDDPGDGKSTEALVLVLPEGW